MLNNCCCRPSLLIAYPREGQTYSNVNEAYGFTLPCVSVKIKFNGTVYSTRAFSDGYWRIPLPNVDCGSYTINAKICVCCESINQSVNFNIARFIPAPTITTPTSGSTVTDDPIVVAGTANPNYVVKISIGNAAPVTAVADANGNYTYNLPKPAEDGAYIITVTEEPPFISNCIALPTSIPITVSTPTA